ncbi:MAG: AAA family ATPase [Jatrophihabitans sp.]|uniref:AAA family ATPase n=1 Tax=Jatrophihabitans sp. TaxID=1932789 RepID=UPI003F7DEB24
MILERPVLRVEAAREVDPDDPPRPERWPCTIPAVQQLLDDGLELAPLTVLVGENGSGKSTLVEAIAMRFGFSPEGGSTGARHSTRPTESGLHRWLWLRRGINSPRWGFFLRAETMHGFYSYLEANPVPHDIRFHELSHGESFLEVLASRFADAGFYVLDEPESALSFTACLSLVSRLREIAESRHSQALVATHSPLIAATPGARIVEVGPWGLRETSWQELELVQHWRAFLDDPDSYLRHL